jgi:uncharacterized protein (DUF58 family)
MPDSKRFLHPETIQRISPLDVRARFIVEGFLAGMHRSPHFGQSVEFRQHREYVAGDDLRDVDWKVWARQDRMYIKQYEEDANLRCYLLVDVSASMAYGHAEMTKYEYGCTIAACLAYLLLKQQDAVGCATFDTEVRKSVQPKTRRTHIHKIIDAMNVSHPQDGSNFHQVLRRVTEKVQYRSMVVLVSDLLGERDDVLSGIRLLRGRGHDVLVFHVLDDDELDFPFTGPTRFEGLELPDFLNCNPRALRDGYLESLQDYLDVIRRGCTALAVDYNLIRTSDPMGAVLAAFLNNRLRISRKH